MMVLLRRVLASLLDVVGVGVFAYGGFRLALLLVLCKDFSDCALLTPFVIAGVILSQLIYFGPAFLLWRSTLGQRVFWPRRSGHQNSERTC